MLMRHLHLVLCLFFLPQSLVAQGTLAGRVASAKGEFLVGANVVLQGTVRGTVTNAQGEFRFTGVASGTYSLVFSMVGYQRLVHANVIVRDNEETFLAISLVERPLESEPVVVTASKREQSLAEVPVSISVIDAVEIRRRNSVTIDEALRYVSGVNMTGPQINIRGSSGYSLGAGSRVLMLLDGVPFIAGDTGELIFEAIPVGQVDRIEVVKGASSALYGSNALGGVINIITKPITGRPETSIRTYGGFYADPSSDQWKWSSKTRFLHGQSIGLTRTLDDLGLSLFFSRQRDDGYRQNDARSRYNLYLKARQEFSATSALTLNAGLLHQTSGQFLYWRNLDSALMPPLRHERDDLKSTRYFVSSLFSAVLSEHMLFTGKALWSHNVWGFQQTEDKSRTESNTDGFRLEGSMRLLADTVHTLTVGLDGNLDMIGGAMFQTRTIGGLALYAQDEIRLAHNLAFTLGLRSDFQSVGLAQEGIQVNPKAAVLYMPWEGTSIRASYGRGFRVPSVAEAFIAAGGGFVKGVPNTGLNPERSASYEVGVSNMLSDIASIDIAAFRSDYTNLIEPGLIVSGQDLELQWRNVITARVQGVESSVRLAFFDGALSTTIGYTYVYPEDLTKRDLLKYRPRHVLYTNALTRFWFLTLGGDFRFVSRVDRIDDQLVETGIVPDGNERADILVADFRIGADFAVGGVDFSSILNIKNAFQRNYVELIGNLMPPRTYILTLEVRL